MLTDICAAQRDALSYLKPVEDASKAPRLRLHGSRRPTGPGQDGLSHIM